MIMIMTAAPLRFLAALVALLLLAHSCHATYTSSPVVGVLSQPRIRDNYTEYYVAASYVKWLELAGTRAIVIPYDASDELVDEIFSQINGVLFPGGGSDLPSAARRIWQRALDANSEGDFFPIWATCLGYEYVLMLASLQGESILQPGFDAENISLPLELVDVENSRLYSNPNIQRIVTTQNVTLNNHELGLEPSLFHQDEGLTSMFHITSINHDRQGRPFVSTIEPNQPGLHPFYSVQYHPEKNPFEFATAPGSPNSPYEEIDHSADGIYYSFYMAQFFGDLLRKNLIQGTHEYIDDERHPLVYSYPMKHGYAFEQVFIIPLAYHWDLVDDDENVLILTDHGQLRGYSAEP